MRRSSGCQSQAMRSACTPASSERWVWTAPLGSPVVPEVYTINASSCGSAASRRDLARAVHTGAVRPGVRTTTSATSAHGQSLHSARSTTQRPTGSTSPAT